MEAGTKKPIVFHGNRTVSHFVQMLGTMDPYMSVYLYKRKRHPRESKRQMVFVHAVPPSKRSKTCQNMLKPLLLKLMLEHLRCHVSAPFKRNRWDLTTVQANMRFWIARCASVKYQGHSDLGLMVRPWFAEVCRRAWIQATRSWSQHLSRRHQWTLTFRGRKKVRWISRYDSKAVLGAVQARFEGETLIRYMMKWSMSKDFYSKSSMFSLDIFWFFNSLDSDDGHFWIWPCWSHTISHSQQWNWMATFCRKIVCQYSR